MSQYIYVATVLKASQVVPPLYTFSFKEFPSEVGPSAAGQCRLPDFGGRKLS